VTTRRQRREARRLRSLRLRALLAAGLALGVGAGGTLASWTDNEYGNVTFTSGTFNIVGSTDGTSYSDHTPAGSAAALTLAVGSGAGSTSAMTPGTTAYAFYSVKTTVSSVAGTVQLIAGTPTGLPGSVLQYGVSVITGTTCNASTFAAGTVLLAATTTPVVAWTAGSTQTLPAAGASAVNYCFEIGMLSSAPNTVLGQPIQGQTMTQTWQFAATAS
jgi:predicted ribosomally synthesized peptide with SipW-like signal peptide